MPNFVRCPDENHLYDKDKNSKCPECGTKSSIRSSRFGGKGAAPASETSNEKTQIYGSKQEDPTQMYGAPPRPPAAGGSSAPGVTVARWKKEAGIDPVVGWLVCIEGPNQGRDYRLHAGNNTIGRDSGNNVCIAGDEGISRLNHARIFFDHKSNAFHVIAADGRSGVYVNDSAVLSPTALQAHDTLEIGSSRLRFVAFCSEGFRWELNSQQKNDPSA